MKVTFIMPKITTRNSIFDYLSKHPLATSDEISRRFAISGATARHHLLLLAEEGRISVSSTRLKNERGRPFQTYDVIEKGTAINFAQILSIILETSSVTEDSINSLLKEIGKKIRIANPEKAENLTIRLIQLVDQLTKSGYQARWEVHKNFPQIIFESCPYAMIENREKLFCGLDQRLLQNALGRTIDQTKRFELSDSGHRVCKFTLV